LAGIYLHIPFCRQACAYCNFHFTTSLRYKDDLVAAILKETDLQKGFLEGEAISTIYFGGGTPSLLKIQDCRLILEQLMQHFEVDTNAEITLEANPDDINREKLSGWKDAGINRLSIGIQSFFEDDLRWMNRAHNSRQARQCIEDSLTNGFSNLSIDLIYGTPLLTDEMWQQNVATAAEYDIPHLSCYALTVEERTPLHKQILLKTKEDVDSDKQARQFLQLMQWLKEKGYEHYEVSNFAKPGCRSRHNSSYWREERYLGLGPSAHSYNGVIRKWNIANNNSYIASINKGVVPEEKEQLTKEQQLNEYIMISLRTMEGMDLEKIATNWGRDKIIAMEKRLSIYKDDKLLKQTGSTIQLTDEGMLMADGIAADLFTPIP
jgi:oxygen-independent coproporphyrinogen-3 oxidase